jgi:hypothetical protein
MIMTILKGLTLVAALFAGGISLAMAQNGLPTGNNRPVHHRVTHVQPAIYNMVPDAIGGICPANGGPSCSNQGPAPPDSW